MHFLSNIIKNPAIVAEIEAAVGRLYEVGAIAALMEIRIERNKPQPTAHPLETNAARAAWADGYADCLQDLCQFRARFLAKPQEGVQPAMYGAGERSLASGDLTEEEYAKLFGRQPPGGIAPKQLLPRKSA